MALDDRELLEVAIPRLSDTEVARKRIYANLWIGYWLMAWQAGEMEDRAVSQNAAILFGGSVAREWWADYGDVWRIANSRRDARFIALVQREWRAAVERSKMEASNASAATLLKSSGPAKGEGGPGGHVRRRPQWNFSFVVSIGRNEHSGD